MEALRRLAESFANLNPDLLLFKIWQQPDTQDFIITLNRQRQLFDEGVTSENVIMGTYSPFTFREKVNRFGSFPRHYTLLDTGEFYESFRVLAASDGFLIEADLLKPDVNLQEKFGQGTDILGLTEQSKEELVNLLIPKIVEQILLR